MWTREVFDTLSSNCAACPAGCLACVSRGTNYVCKPCASGFWFNSNTNTCQACSTCAAGFVVQSDCSSFSDQACVEPGLGLPNFGSASWDDVIAQASGQTLNFWQWAGDDIINAWTTNYVIQQLKTLYNISTVMHDNGPDDNLFKSTVQAEVGHASGSVDLMWINGLNYKTLREQNLLYRGWISKIPNSAFYNLTDPSIAFDFGYPADAEFPYNVAQVVMIYDQTRVPAPPLTIPDFVTWIKAHPGRWTYAAPSTDYTGSVMMRSFFYVYSGPYTDYGSSYNADLYNSRVQDTWNVLNEIAPYLYQNATTGKPHYPESQVEIDQLFRSGSIDFDLSYDPAEAARQILNGQLPSSTKTFVWNSGTIGNTNYLAIPQQSPHKAAALVAVNFLASLDACWSRAQPANWGALQALDHALIPQSWSTRFDAIWQGASLSLSDLSSHLLGELGDDYVQQLQVDWVTHVRDVTI